MRIVAVRCKNNERVHAALLPGAEQIVHPAVQGLAAHRGVTRIWTFDGGVDAVGHRRGAQEMKARGQIVGEPLDDERIAAERQMGTVLFAGADWNQQP